MAKTDHLRTGALVAGVLVAVGMLVLIMVVVEAKPAEATFPGKNGNIAYVSRDATGGVDFEIYTISPGGGGGNQFTYNSRDDTGPSYSSNGQHIASSGPYPGEPPGRENINIYDVGSRGWINLTDNGDSANCEGSACDSHDPSYSPDGKKIAYDGHSPQGGNYEIYTISTDGGGTRVQLTNDPKDDRHPSYSPDGKKIAFDSNRSGTLEIYTINADGTGTFQVTHNNTANDRQPSYSPDGKKIAYAGKDGHDYEIYTINADGTGAFQVTHNDTNDYHPSYSPDGQKIAYSGYDDVAFPGHPAASNDFEIYTINADGVGRRVKLTNNETSDYEPSWGSPPVVGIKPRPPAQLGP